MAKILQIIDVDSEGHKIRLDDGRVIRMPHNSYPQIGEEFDESEQPRRFINANDFGELGR